MIIRSKIIVRYNIISNCNEYTYTEWYENSPIDLLIEYNKKIDTTFITIRYKGNTYHQTKNCRAISVHHYIRDFKYFLKEVRKNGKI